jgi:Ca-activated chloride channel family protein
VLLTDGVNDDGDTSDDTRQLEALLASVANANDGENTTPVRIFTVAYGSGANPAELKRIAEASNATAYQATDATTIDAVFTSVISNF